jgi:hypothetical protein
MEDCEWKRNKDDAKKEAARRMIIQIEATTFS